MSEQRITNDIHGTLHQVERDLEAAEDRADQAEAQLQRNEEITREMMEWVGIALLAGGWSTVFDIPDWKKLDAELHERDPEHTGMIASLSAQLQRLRESADKLAYFLEQAAEHLPWYTKRDPDSDRAQAFEWFAGDAQRALAAYRSTTEGEE